MNASHSPPGLFILGMHRSGTSCLAGMLESAGFNAGDVDEWNPDNPLGNREHLAVTPLNEGLLRMQGGTWDQPPDNVVVDDRQRREMYSIVAGLEDSGRPWFIKDPRILLLPEPWLALRPGARCVGIFRHPVAVAQSLERRDGLSLAHGVTLWNRYNQGLLALLRDEAFPLLLFSSDSGRLVRATEALLIEQFSDDIGRFDLQLNQLASFFKDDLVHHTPALALDIAPALEAAGVSDSTAREANELWQALVTLQHPEALALDVETPAVPQINLSGRPEGPDPGDAAAVDQAIENSTDPIGLFRARIQHLESSDDKETLRAWLARWVERRPEDPFLNWELAKAEWNFGAREGALEHAQAAARLAPGWAEPQGKLAEWAWAAEDWRLAAESYRALYTAHRSVTREPILVAQLFFDHGAGFSAEACVTLPLEGLSGHFDLRFDAQSGVADDFDNRLLRLRFDPVNTTAIIADLDLYLVDAQGRERPVDAAGDNALFSDKGTRYFETDDPQVFFDMGDSQPATAVRVRFDLCYVDDDARAATFRTLLTLREQLEEANRSGADLAVLDERWKAFESTLTEVRGSVSGRVGTAVTRTMMKPASLGRGDTGISRLAERWTELDEALRNLLDRRKN
jgi:hypothetical protein